MKAQIKGPFDDLNAAGEPFISEDAIHNGRNTLGLVDLRPLMMQGQMPQMMEQMKSMGGSRRPQ